MSVRRGKQAVCPSGTGVGGLSPVWERIHLITPDADAKDQIWA